jgi:RsiW-degrading membrane proteinase PrsW (M82 family)
MVQLLIGLLLSIVAGVVPTIAYVVLVWIVDRHEKEPIPLLATAFLWGAIPAVILSAAIEIAFDVPLAIFSQGYAEFVSTSVIAPVVEELFKGVALLSLYWFASREFDGLLDGIIYGSMIGLGFAMTENVFYFVGAWVDQGIQAWGMTVFFRAMAFGLNHAMYTAFTGIGFGLARHRRSRRERWALIALGLAAAILAHLLHNALVSAEDLCFLSLFVDWAGVLVVFIIVMWAWKRERKWIAVELADEVSRGTLTPLQYETSTSQRGRLRHGKSLGMTHPDQMRLWRKLVANATELAFKKHQLNMAGADAKLSETIETLRARLLELRQQLESAHVPGR